MIVEQTRIARFFWRIRVWIGGWLGLSIAWWLVFATVWPIAAVAAQLRAAAVITNFIDPFWAWQKYPIWIPRSLYFTSASAAASVLERAHGIALRLIETHMAYLFYLPLALSLFCWFGLIGWHSKLCGRRGQKILDDEDEIRGAGRSEGDDLSRRINKDRG